MKPSLTGQGSLKGECYVLITSKWLQDLLKMVAYLLSVDCPIANCINYGLVLGQNYGTYDNVQPIMFRSLH